MAAWLGSEASISKSRAYNILTDPIANNQAGLGLAIQRAFSGECVAASACLPQAALQKLSIFASGTKDILFIPIWGDMPSPEFVACVFIIDGYYAAGNETAKAKRIIEDNWREPFDLKELADELCINAGYLGTMFLRAYGISMQCYHDTIKVSHIKDKLKDFELTITEAFDICGADIREGYAEVFEQITGQTPREYRDSL